MFKRIIREINAVKERDPAARSTVEVLLCYPGIHALIFHRIAHFLHRCSLTLLPRLVSQFSRWFTGIEIHPGAKIGEGLFIDHGMGVVIGETTEIGDNCTLYQGVTLGGTGKDKGKRHPTLGNNVMVGAGAKILGPFTVGDDSKVAANAVVLSEVPPNCTAVGVPARVVKRDGIRLYSGSQLDQVHIPDPVAQELCYLKYRLEKLSQQVERLAGEDDRKPAGGEDGPGAPR